MTEQDSGIGVGIEILSATEAQELANGGQNAGYTFGLLQLLRPHVQELAEAPQTFAEKVQLVETAFSRSHLQLSNAAWAGYIVGGISPWVQLDSDDHAVRESAELLVKQQIQWAAHMGLSAIVFTCPAEGPIVNFARLVNQTLSMVAYTQIVIRVMLDPEVDPWGRWNLIRNLCDHNPKLSLALELKPELPDDALLKKWFAEPLRTVILPGNSFLTNNKGFPVLSKRHQQFTLDLMEHNVEQFVVSLETPESVHEAGGLAAYQQYLQYLHRTRPELNDVDKFATGYHDYLQSPLQPLMDNLVSATYDVFEKDPVKYREYEKAVYQALRDRKPDAGTCVVMVVGAGRGPLVERVLRAADAANRAVRVYAVEKNPNAVVTKEDEWADRVTVVHCDMRYWEAPEKADILVSELLGSLGDNELSPNVLMVHSDDGISIPCNYTAFVAPISSTKLFNEVSAYKDQEHMETPYVVKFRAVHELGG
ncbi:hypothetical protein HK104_005609 [Borealophlyctis nickersoniae]|nr:hypothetical protein HK104_005609 [Borealophlyctis nickersoniae]